MTASIRRPVSWPAAACLGIAFLLGGSATALGAETAAGSGDSAHAAHDAKEHAGHSGHQMEPWMYEALRKRVDLYREYTDAQIDDSMVRMGPDYTDYLSDPALRGEAGVLVLAHGFGKFGDERFSGSIRTIAGNYPVAVSYGMSMTSSRHIQEAVDKLTAAGASRIVVVPALSSSASDDQLRQWQYMFALTDNPGYLETTRIKTGADVTWTPSLEDHPLVVEMIADYARELSRNPREEVVVLVSHGPTAEADNQRNLALLGRIAARLKEKDGYSDVRFMSMQNDAPTAIRAANGRKLRQMVEDANQAGKQVIIVTNLNTQRSIQKQVEDDIKGTRYVFNKKGLVDHPNYAKWVDAVARDAMAKP